MCGGRDKGAWRRSFGAGEDELTEGKQREGVGEGVTGRNWFGGYQGRRTKSGGGLSVLGEMKLGLTIDDATALPGAALGGGGRCDFRDASVAT